MIGFENMSNSTTVWFNTLKCSVSSFKWIKINELAKIISSEFNDCPIYNGIENDDVQRDALKEPDETVLKYWQPETSIERGVKYVIDKYKSK